MWSATASFTTAKQAGAPYAPFTVAILGDLGRRQYDGASTLDALNASAPTLDFVWHLGDVGYADDSFLHDPLALDYEEAFDEYMDQVMDAFSSRVPYMVAPGNHEGECHSPRCIAAPDTAFALNNFTAYNTRFRMPSRESNGSANMWYSFDHGPLHVVVVNTETDFPDAPGDSYIPWLDTGGFCDPYQCNDWTAWLQRDLAAVDRAKTPWVVVGGHRPVYSVKNTDEDSHAPTGDSKNLQAAVEHLFRQYNVDVFFCGHEHSYERTERIHNTTYILTGCAGEDEGHSNYESAVDTNWNVLWNNTVYGHGELRVHNDTAMTWTQYNAKTGGVLDTVTFTKDPQPA